MDYKPTETLFSRKEGFIETYTGAQFHPDKPIFKIEDIAHSTAMLCRFNGHCREFYSVAEHSVLVAELVRLEGGSVDDQLEGLLHDACEAYVSDMPAPYKQYCPDLVTLENRIESGIREHFNLSPTKVPIVKKCDMIALYIEAYHLMPSKGSIFTDPYGLKSYALGLSFKFEPLNFAPEEGERLFLQKFDKLTADLAINSA